MDIGAWLRELGLERYEQAFRENEIDAGILLKLTVDDLKDIGVTTVGHRRKLLEAIAALAEPALAPQAEPSTPAAGAPRARPAEAERRQLTVMFVDLAGSTALSRRIDPEEMSVIIRAYQNAVAGEITRFEGHVAKFMGDGVLAYFGYPRAHEDEAERAVRAALALADAVGKLVTPAGKPLAARIGIATGLVVVGELIGEGSSEEQAVVGETPNLAARLQALAEPGMVVIAASTRRLVGGVFELSNLGAHELKGFDAPIAAFAVMGEQETPSRFEARSGPSLLPMVGRDQELALLLERWALAKAGEGQCVLLVGEAGIGKSRIVRALLDALAGTPHTRIRYQCSAYHTDSAFWPVIQQLGHGAGLAAGDPTEVDLDKLEALLDRAKRRDAAPLIADLLGLDGSARYLPLDLTPQAQRARTLAALVDQLLGLATRWPVLVVLEDAHWVDPTTLEMIELALDRIAAAPVLLLLTSRPDRQPALAAHPHVTRLTLNRLGRGGVEAIVARLGGEGLSPETIGTIIARTDGVPLFVEELTKAVLETGEMTVPASLHDSLMARLDRISEVKEIAQTAACIGRAVDFSLLAAVADRREADLCAGLDRLVESELMFRRGTPPEATYTFKHALVQEAAHASLLRARRQQLHARIAEALEERARQGAAIEPEGLARHYMEAVLPERAIPHLLKAGERAAARSASPEAIGHFSRALELVSALPEGEARDRQELQLRVALVVPLIAVHGFGSTEVEACAKRAKELSDVLGAMEHRFSVVRALWNSSLMRRPVPETLALSAELLQLAEAADDPAQLAVARRSRGYSLFFACRLAEARDELFRGIELADSIADAARFWVYGEHPAMVCRVYGGWALALLGEVDRAVAVAENGVTIARRLANVHTVAWALSCLALVQALRRDAKAVRATAGEAIELARSHRLPQWLAWSTFFDGWSTAETGDLFAGIADMERGLARWHATGAVLSSTLFHGLFAAALCEAGDPKRGRAELQAAFAHLDGFGERYMEPELHRIESAFRRREGARPEWVEAALRKSMELAEAQDARLWQLRAVIDLARLWREQGRGDEARNLLVPVYHWFTEGFDTADLNEAKALLEELR